MSNLLPSPEPERCLPAEPEPRRLEALPDRAVRLGSLEVHRVLPVRGRRLIGGWCFFDRYGPLSFSAGKPMDVAPHPHIGLQTVTWLFDGEILHNDSLGSECMVRPGQLSLMTAGRGIAHTEETPAANSGKLDGVQLWVALPDSSRTVAPHYQCTGGQPEIENPGGRVIPILGEFLGARSEGMRYSGNTGAEIVLHPNARLELPLDRAAEYGILLASGDAEVFGSRIQPNTLYYLGSGRDELGLHSNTGARLLLIGGPPFGESVLIWWNFVARTAEEIAEARRAWESHELFGDVPRYQGPRLTAPQFLGRPVAS